MTLIAAPDSKKTKRKEACIKSLPQKRFSCTECPQGVGNKTEPGRDRLQDRQT